MMFFRKSRLVYLVAREVSKKYTLPLLIGFFLGIFGMIAIKQLFPKLSMYVSTKTLRIGVVGDVTPTTLPMNIQELLSSGLTRVSPDQAPIPGLALSWEATESGKSYDFTIREDALWHNGKPVLPKDINYNIRDVSFEVISPRILRATLKEPFAPFLSLVAKPILEKGLRGFGPYRVANVRFKGDTVQFLRLDPVTDITKPSREYRFFRTEAAAITAYQLGDIDNIEELSTKESIANWKTAHILDRPRYDRVVALYFNTKDPLLGEKAVRQALGYAVTDLGFERAYSPIAKTSWAYTDTIKKYDFDLPQAKKLMTNAHVASQSAGLTITTFSQYIDVAQKIASSWTNLGVPTIVQVVNTIGPFQVLLAALSLPPDPDQYPLWHSTQQATNLTGYVNVKIDKLLEDGRKELDQEKRKKIYVDFAKRLVEDAPAIFLYYPTTYTVTRRK
ncbi:MAG: ABC transporter substrate-binding protein [Patescibacteria group bacterium]